MWRMRGRAAPWRGISGRRPARRRPGLRNPRAASSSAATPPIGNGMTHAGRRHRAPAAMNSPTRCSAAWPARMRDPSGPATPARSSGLTAICHGGTSAASDPATTAGGAGNGPGGKAEPPGPRNPQGRQSGDFSLCRRARGDPRAVQRQGSGDPPICPAAGPAGALKSAQRRAQGGAEGAEGKAAPHHPGRARRASAGFPSPPGTAAGDMADSAIAGAAPVIRPIGRGSGPLQRRKPRRNG